VDTPREKKKEDARRAYLTAQGKLRPSQLETKSRKHNGPSPPRGRCVYPRGGTQRPSDAPGKAEALKAPQEGSQSELRKTMESWNTSTETEKRASEERLQREKDIAQLQNGTAGSTDRPLNAYGVHAQRPESASGAPDGQGQWHNGYAERLDAVSGDLGQKSRADDDKWLENLMKDGEQATAWKAHPESTLGASGSVYHWTDTRTKHEIGQQNEERAKAVTREGRSTHPPPPPPPPPRPSARSSNHTAEKNEQTPGLYPATPLPSARCVYPPGEAQRASGGSSKDHQK
jgi:hypothetical protein